jgi:hypothetical protein
VGFVCTLGGGGGGGGGQFTVERKVYIFFLTTNLIYSVIVLYSIYKVPYASELRKFKILDSFLYTYSLLDKSLVEDERIDSKSSWKYI